MTDKTQSESKAWKENRDAANKSTMASSESLKDDALTDVEPGVKLKTDLKAKTEEE